MNCFACARFSGRMEICVICAPMVWPHRIVNPGSARLAKAVFPVRTVTAHK